MAIVARERRHARIRNRSVLLHEASVGKRLMQGKPIERVAMQVENISRCGFKWHDRSPLFVLLNLGNPCRIFVKLARHHFRAAFLDGLRYGAWLWTRFSRLAYRAAVNRRSRNHATHRIAQE